MGGPTSHGQRNKAHKSGKGQSNARNRHAAAKEGMPGHRGSAKSSVQGGKVNRMLASKQQRDAKRQELLEKKRKANTPIVLGILPLSEDVDVKQVWRRLIKACASPAGDEESKAREEGDEDIDMGDEMAEEGEEQAHLGLRTISVHSQPRVRLTLLPPLTGPNRADPLSIVDLGRSAEVLLLAISGSETSADKGADSAGEAALGILRALGLPDIVGVVAGGGKGGTANMKERSASKKRAEKAISAQIAGEHKVFHVDNGADYQQLLRHLANHTLAIPHWKRQRASLMVEDAEFKADVGSEVGSLRLTAHIRYAGLSANQLVTIPGVGDFQVDRIEGVHASDARKKGGATSEMDTSGSAPVLLAQADPKERETLNRVNETDELDAEQTWPSQQELIDAEVLHRQMRKKKVPKGTSEYQAAWILDDYGDGDDDDDDEDDDNNEHAMGEDGENSDEPPELELDEDDDDMGAAMEDEEDEDKLAALHRELKAKRAEQEQDEEYPDEVDLNPDTPGRVRLQKYRGLKSFRSSKWDNKEWLPQDYAKVFAFENFKRTQKRAIEAVNRATNDTDPCGAAPGAYAVITLISVSSEQAAKVAARVEACQAGQGLPLVAFGLMQHEGKLSVINFAIRKVPSYEEVVPNKEELLFCTGVRSWSCRPVFSADSPGDKQKMERFLQPGRHSVASVYAPIMYPQLPLLAFKKPGGADAGTSAMRDDEDGTDNGVVRLVATGSLRSCDPDRVVLKKIVLTGYPVRVNKKRATVRFMFHHPDDIKWFRPVELYTKSGRRGRITEPLGTHGAMKTLWDGPVQQNDAVCMALYKRAFPKWPSSLDFIE